MRRQWVLAGIGFLAAAAVAGAVLLFVETGRRDDTPRAGAVAPAAVGGAFRLVDHNGRAVTEGDFLGRFLVVYFGYTFCPDVCPTELQTISDALDLLADKAEAFQPVFITVDPERDTVEALAAYVPHFHPRLIGLTGRPDQVAAAARVYGVQYGKVRDGAPAAGAYLMNHTAFVYLMAPDGRFLTFFRSGTTAAEMARRLGAWLDRAG